MTNSGFSFNKEDRSLVEFASISIWACILSFCGVFFVSYPVSCHERGKIQEIFLCGWKPLFIFVAQKYVNDFFLKKTINNVWKRSKYE